MNQITLEKIIDVTRTELEDFSKRVYIRGANRQSLSGFCLIGTYLLCKTTEKFNIDLVPVRGKYCRLGSFSMNPDNTCHHWWADYNGTVIDITASQFIIDKVYIGKPGKKYWELERGFNFSNWSHEQSPLPHEKRVEISLEHIENTLLL